MHMPTEYEPSRSRRSRRGGRQGRGSRRRGGRSNTSEKREPVTPSKPKTLWEKIVAFFSGEPAEAPRPAARKPKTEAKPKPAGTPKSKTPRRPEKVEVTSPRIYVGNLSFDATESDLHELFRGIGLVQNVEIVANKHTQRSKGFGFVQMQTIEEAQRAVTELHDKEYMGRKLVVSGAKATAERRSDRAEQQPEQ